MCKWKIQRFCTLGSRYMFIIWHCLCTFALVFAAFEWLTDWLAVNDSFSSFFFCFSCCLTSTDDDDDDRMILFGFYRWWLRYVCVCVCVVCVPNKEKSVIWCESHTHDILSDFFIILLLLTIPNISWDVDAMLLSHDSFLFLPIHNKSNCNSLEDEKPYAHVGSNRI